MKKGYLEVRNSRYQRWIDKNVPIECRQLCKTKAEEMVETFPELRIVGEVGIFESHAWCVDKNNKVVDPTAHQYSCRYNYETTCRLDFEDFPKNKCMNCGELIWPDTPRIRELKGDYELIGPHVHCNEILEWEQQEIMEEIERELKEGR